MTRPEPYPALRPNDGWLPHGLLIAYGLVWLVTAINPASRQDWFLENLLVFAAVPPLVVTFHRFRFSNVSYVLITVFLALHAVGAHYTYSEVPLFNWLRDDWQMGRNHYDRVVHFLFGLLLIFPLCELLMRIARLPKTWACIGAVHVVMAWSALYEICEASVAHLVSPELGAAYNGTQGDIWDAQKDAALALAGAVLAMTLSVFWQSRGSETQVPALTGVARGPEGGASHARERGHGRIEGTTV